MKAALHFAGVFCFNLRTAPAYFVLLISEVYFVFCSDSCTHTCPRGPKRRKVLRPFVFEEQSCFLLFERLSAWLGTLAAFQLLPPIALKKIPERSVDRRLSSFQLGLLACRPSSNIKHQRWINRFKSKNKS